MPNLQAIYRALTDLGAPLIDACLGKRLKQGREDAARFSERKGMPSLPRPPGKLLWCHAASVGESLSLLALIDKIRSVFPGISILVTTGTVTSATLMLTRLPPGAYHQYIPVDRAPWVERFLNHWKPDIALWVESELWPNLLCAVRERHIPSALLNARMSDKSYHAWQRYAPGWCRNLLAAFSLVLAQTERDAQRLSALGATQVKCLGNLKFAAAPASCDEAELASLREQIGQRPVWLIASTHPGEEELALLAHKSLRLKYARLLTIVVPRHPARGNDLATLIAEQHGLNVAQRSRKEPVRTETEIYLADTLGELGLFYRLAPIVAMGGSLLAGMGGHNPIEPAQLGAAIVLGPSMRNFEEIAQAFATQRAALKLASNEELCQTIDFLLSDANERQRLAQAAQNLATASRQKTLDDTLAALRPLLKA